MTSVKLNKNRMLFYVIGLFVLTCGIAMTIISKLGTSPFDALLVGLHSSFGLTVGSWEFILGVILVFVNALFLKGRPNFLAIFTAFLTGVGIDFWLFIFNHTWVPTGLLGQSIILLFGIVLVGIGIATYLQADFAPSPVDGSMMMVQKLTGLKISTSKTIVAGVLLVLAWLFHGPIGFGTILIFFINGPVIGIFFPKLAALKHTLDRLKTEPPIATLMKD